MTRRNKKEPVADEPVTLQEPPPAPPVYGRIETFDQFLTHAEKGARAAGAQHESHTDDDDFAGCSWPEAVRMARYGWPEGVAAVRDAMPLDGGVEPIAAWDLGPVGSFVCMPAFLSGSPVSMFERIEIEGARRRIALVTNICCMWQITAAERIEYAAAVAQVVADLTAGGVDVAIYAMQVNSWAKQRFSSAVAIREFGEPFDLTRIAFSAHPAFHRRIGFAWRENSPAFVPIATGGYGIAEDVTAADIIGCGLELDPEAIKILPRLCSRHRDTAYWLKQFRESIA